jgi:hypothetical protein
MRSSVLFRMLAGSRDYKTVTKSKGEENGYG